MVHGSTFDAVDCQTNFPIAKEAGAVRGFDYLAIGDTHSFRNVPDKDTRPPVVRQSKFVQMKGADRIELRFTEDEPEHELYVLFPGNAEDEDCDGYDASAGTGTGAGRSPRRRTHCGWSAKASGSKTARKAAENDRKYQ